MAGAVLVAAKTFSSRCFLVGIENFLSVKAPFPQAMLSGYKHRHGRRIPIVAAVSGSAGDTGTRRKRPGKLVLGRVDELMCAQLEPQGCRDRLVQ